jgi:hypothetical protein
VRAGGAGGLHVALDSATAVLLDDVGAAVAAAVALTSLSRYETSTVLWLDEDEHAELAAGLVVVVAGAVLAAHSWTLTGDHDEGDAIDITDALHVRDAHVALRALMRRQGDPRSLLAEATELLQLPPQAISLLRGSSDLAAAGLRVEADSRRTAFRRAREAARLVPLQPWLAMVERFQWVLPAVLALQFFVRAALAAADRTGDRGDDVVGFAVLGVITCVATVMAGRRSRRSIKREAELRQAAT